MPNSANYYVSPLSGSNISNFALDVSNIAAQQGGGTGLIYVAVSDNLEGLGILGNPLKTKDSVQFVSVTATNNISAQNNISSSTITANSVTGSFKGNGSQITNITASNITNFISDVEGQFDAGANLTYATGTYVLNNTINLSSVTASFNGNGSQVTNITASNITNFTADTRAQLSGSQYISYDSGIGVFSLPYTGSILGTTPIVLGQTASTVTGLTSISASLGTFTTLTASAFNLGTLNALTTSTGDLTVNNLIVNGVIENAAGAIQAVTSSAYQIIPSTSLIKISGTVNTTLNATFPTIKTTGYNEGTRIFIVNIGSSVITFKDDQAVAGTKLKMASQTYNQAQWGCIQFVLVSGSLGKVWVEAGRGA